MKEIYYINSAGVRLDLLKPPYMLQTGNIFDYEWSYKSVQSSDTSGRITGFKRGIQKRKLKLSILNYSRQSYYEAINKFSEIVEYDVLNKVPGELHFGDQYIKCYFITSEKTDWENDIELLDNEVTLAIEHPFWITEQRIQLLPSSRSASKQPGLGFPFGFPFDFAPKKSGSETVRIEHYKPSNFKMIFYGPCIDPVLKVNDYPYQIHTTLKEGEYLEIDSRKNTVTKYALDGTTENLYNSREFKYSVFEQIPSGGVRFIWDGTFGIDIILYLERSEPKW